jgi:hypothetical protein
VTANIRLNGLDWIFRILNIPKRDLEGGTWSQKSKSIRPVQQGE